MPIEMTENDQIESNYGLKEAIQNKWNNNEWIRYKLTGMTPEDTVAEDNGLLEKREERVLKSILSSVKELEKERIETEEKAQLGIALKEEEPTKEELDAIIYSNIFISKDFEKGSKETQLALLQLQYETMLYLDRNNFMSPGFSIYSKEDISSIREQHIGEFDYFLEKAKLTQDSDLQAKLYRNAYYLSEDIFERKEYRRVRTAINALVDNAELPLVRALLMEDDYAFNTAVLISLQHDSEHNGIPHYYDLSLQWGRERGNSPEIIEAYGKFLLEPLLVKAANIIQKKNLEEFAGLGGSMDLLCGILKELRGHPEIMATVLLEGIDLQQLSDNLFKQIYDSNTKSYNISTTSDGAWQSTARTLRYLYMQNVPNALKVPEQLDRTFVNRLLEGKEREETRNSVVKMADALKI